MMQKSADDLAHVTGNVYANEAGRRFWEQFQQKPKDKFADVRCFRAEGLICPFLREGGTCICKDMKNSRQLVKIGHVNWRTEQEPIGQMSLFEPRVTHRRIWVHYKTGARLPDYPEPTFVSIFCKRMAVAFTKWLEKVEGWDVPAWRIVPMTNTKADANWKDEMITRHGMKPCVFDEF